MGPVPWADRSFSQRAAFFLPRPSDLTGWEECDRAKRVDAVGGACVFGRLDWPLSSDAVSTRAACFEQRINVRAARLLGSFDERDVSAT